MEKESEPAPTSADAENQDTEPTTDVPSAVGQSEIRSDTHSIEGDERDERDEVELDAESEPSANPHEDSSERPDVIMHDAESGQNFSLPPPPILMQVIPTMRTQSPTILSTISMIQPRIGTPKEANRSLWIPDIPSQVTLSQIYDSLCGGAIERVECFPHKRSDGYSASITFVEHSAAKNYLGYVRTPQGRIVFRGVPSIWRYDVQWNPRPPQTNFRVMSMACNPYVRARRCLIIRNFPVEHMSIEELVAKLGKLGGDFSKLPRAQKILIDKEHKEAIIYMQRISCAVQLMDAKICGKWGEEFEQSTFTFGKDECERPIPDTDEEDPTERIPNETYTEAQNEIPIASLTDPQYDLYRSHQDFPKMRSLYILALPSRTTVSDLVAQIRGGALERIILNRKASGYITAVITFVHHSSAKAWYEHTTSPAGRIRFPGVVWDWNVRWETSLEPVGRDIWHSFMDPAVKARRGFVLKNLSSRQEISAETLKDDVLSQSNKRISFEKIEVDWKKHEAKVIMASIGSAIGGIAVIKRLRRYTGCRIEFLRDECEDPILLANTVEKQMTASVNNTNCVVDNSDVITQGTVLRTSYTKTLLIKHLPAPMTLRQLSNRIRGGALDNLHIRTCCGDNDSSASITFLESCAAESYFAYLAANPIENMDVSWGRDVATKSAGVLSKDVRRVLIVKGFPSVFKESNIVYEIEKVVKHSAWVLKIGQNNTIESITVKGKERKIARVVLASVRLAVTAKAGMPRFWNAEFGLDECEGPLTELESA